MYLLVDTDKSFSFVICAVRMVIAMIGMIISITVIDAMVLYVGR